MSRTVCLEGLKEEEKNFKYSITRRNKKCRIRSK